MTTALPDDPRLALMFLSTMVEPGDAELDDLLGDSDPVTAPTIASTPHPARAASALAQQTAACGSRVIIPTDSEWPTQLDDLAALGTLDDPHLRPPRCLWVSGTGNLADLSARSVAVVGSRAASEYGKHVADNFAADLAEAGWTVVSGGAFGIDRAAHLGAAARGGPTIAVLPCGMSDPYPRVHRPMFDLIAQTGLLVSEYPPSTHPARSRFLARNRLTAALTGGTVVVEAALRSGSLHTARLVHELGRVLMFTPGPVTSAESSGTHALARRGWDAQLVTRAEEVLHDLRAPERPGSSDGARQAPLEQMSELEAAVLRSLPRGHVVDVGRLAAVVGVRTESVTAALRRLHADGWVEPVAGRWRLVPVQG